MVSLDGLFIQYGTDKSSRSHDYAPAYERYIDPSAITSMLEIGVAAGCSMRAWRAWLPTAEIYGMDKLTDNLDGDLSGFEFIHGDATDFGTVSALPEFDFIVDDGSHQEGEIRLSLDILWPHLRHGGWYVIEDLAAPGFRAGWPLLHYADEVHLHGELLLGRKA